MRGIKRLLKRVLHKAKKKKVVLPKHWRNMYTSFYQISDGGQVIPVSNAQSEVTQFFTLKEANAIFMKSLSLLTKWVSPNIRKDFRQCLQFFNDIECSCGTRTITSFKTQCLTACPFLFRHCSIYSSVTYKKD